MLASNTEGNRPTERNDGFVSTPPNPQGGTPPTVDYP